MLKLLLALLFVNAAGPPAASEAARYREGQVWEYRTRPGDEGSLLKIQRVEDWPAGGRVYHISVIGVHFGGQTAPTELQHLPVSARTLDASVTRLSTRDVAFPSADQGIGIWRENRGGVFDIPLVEILGVVEGQIGGPLRRQEPAPAPVT
jgi:hypothetical protein